MLVRKNSAERDPGNTLKPKKVLSIAKKYLLAIPNEYIDYYTSLPDDPENNAKPVEYATDDEDMTVEQIEQNAKKKRRHKGANQSDKHKLISDSYKPPKNKIGRPPNAKANKFPRIL